MIGDFIIWIKLVWNKQTCIHDYKYVYRQDTGGDFQKCKKCGKLKD